MLNVGIIGYGKMGRIRRDIFDNTSNCQVTMTCDDLAGAPDLPFTSNPHHIINNPTIDIVCICTPNYLIKDLVIKSLQAGKHVFAEKPPGISVAQVREMKTVSAGNPYQKIKFGFNHRYHDAIMTAKTHVDSGEYGDVLWMRGRYGKSVDADFCDSWRAQKAYAGGGILMDQGIHMLDLFLLFMGHVDQVKSFCSSEFWGLDIEDNVFAILRNSKGQTASLHSTMTQWRNLFSLEIFLECGYMVVNGILSSTRSYTDNYGKEELTIAKNRTAAPMAKHNREERFIFDRDYSFNREIAEFVEAVMSATPIHSGTLDDAEKLMQLVEDIYRNDQAGMTTTSDRLATVQAKNDQCINFLRQDVTREIEALGV